VGYSSGLLAVIRALHRLPRACAHRRRCGETIPVFARADIEEYATRTSSGGRHPWVELWNLRLAKSWFPQLGKTVGIHGVSAESPRRERETDGKDSAAGRFNPACVSRHSNT
jgi:hypothetical protein